MFQRYTNSNIYFDLLENNYHKIIIIFYIIFNINQEKSIYLKKKMFSSFFNSITVKRFFVVVQCLKSS